MMVTALKIVISAIIIGVITEVSRRFPAQGGILAALPVVSLLSILWLYLQGEQSEQLSSFAMGVIRGIPSTVVMLIIIGIALKHSVHLFVSLGLGIAGWLAFLLVTDTITKQLVH